MEVDFLENQFDQVKQNATDRFEGFTDPQKVGLLDPYPSKSGLKTVGGGEL